MLKEHYTIRDYWPLITIALLGLATAVAGFILTADLMRAMTLFMGSTLVLLASLKVYNRKDFAMSFKKYDLLASRSDVYAQSYPFIELLLGAGYLFSVLLVPVSAFTFLIMTVGAIGVYQNMQNDEVLMCACLGAVFNVPMTWVTLVEDLLMAIMALFMVVSLL